MKVFPEYFEFTQFNTSKENHFWIKRPYINFYKTLNFNFQEYNANIKLQCVHWHRLLLACMNVFGYFEMLKNIRCQVSNVLLIPSAKTAKGFYTILVSNTAQVLFIKWSYLHFMQTHFFPNLDGNSLYCLL